MVLLFNCSKPREQENLNINILFVSVKNIIAIVVVFVIAIVILIDFDMIWLNNVLKKLLIYQELVFFQKAASNNEGNWSCGYNLRKQQKVKILCLSKFS